MFINKTVLKIYDVSLSFRGVILFYIPVTCPPVLGKGILSKLTDLYFFCCVIDDVFRSVCVTLFFSVLLTDSSACKLKNKKLQRNIKREPSFDNKFYFISRI